jgi:hypothetical protein
VKHAYWNKYDFIMKSLLACLCGAAIVGCSAQGQLDDLTKRTITVSTKNSKLTGVASGAYHNVTVNGYSVTATAGSHIQGIKGMTSSGYIVYSTVQGNLISTSQWSTTNVVE